MSPLEQQGSSVPVRLDGGAKTDRSGAGRFRWVIWFGLAVQSPPDRDADQHATGRVDRGSPSPTSDRRNVWSRAHIG
jgi:hypothetical protein